MRRALREPRAVKMKLLDEIPKFLLPFWLLLPGESSGWAWMSRWSGLSQQQLPDPFPILYLWGLRQVLPLLLARSGSPDCLPFTKELAIPKVCCGLQRKGMERSTESVPSCGREVRSSLLFQGNYYVLGIPGSVTVSAYSVGVWSQGKEAFLSNSCTQKSWVMFLGKKRLFF